MKTNIFSKVAVTMMTVALGAGIVGSISGTVAWFQYSTRSTVAFTGTSAHCTENLQIRLYDSSNGAEDGWKADLRAADITAALKKTSASYKLANGSAGPATTVTTDTFLGQVHHGGTYVFKYDGTNWILGNGTANLATYGIAFTGTAAEGDQIIVKANLFDTVKPITSGEIGKEKVADTFYRNPVYQYPHQDSWATADETDYVVVPVELRVKDVDGAASVTQLAKNIYITKAEMAVKEVAGKGDITSALRLGIEVSEDGGSNFVDYGTFSKDGADVVTHGNLNLNDDTELDTFGDFEWSKGPKIDYGYQYSNSAISVVTTGGVTGATVDKDWFFGKNGIAADTYTFTYDDTGSSPVWKLGSAEVNLAEYGIAYTGTPVNTNTIKVTVVDESATHSNKAESFGLAAVATNVKGIADDSNPYDIKGVAIGKTTATTNLRVNLKIYLEGWKKLGDPASALWDESQFVGAQFNLGVRFSAEAHSDH